MITPARISTHGHDAITQQTERSAMVAATRRLSEAVGRTGLDEPAMLAVAAAINDLCETVETQQLDQVPRITPEEAVGRSDYSWQFHNPAHPGLVMRIDEDGVRASTASIVGSLYEGPTGLLHGGISAMLLDSVLSSLAQYHGVVCVTASLKVDFRRPTPLRQPLEISAALGAQVGRKITAHGEIWCDDELTAEATALFIRLTD